MAAGTDCLPATAASVVVGIAALVGPAVPPANGPVDPPDVVSVPPDDVVVADVAVTPVGPQQPAVAASDPAESGGGGLIHTIIAPRRHPRRQWGKVCHQWRLLWRLLLLLLRWQRGRLQPPHTPQRRPGGLFLQIRDPGPPPLILLSVEVILHPHPLVHPPVDLVLVGDAEFLPQSVLLLILLPLDHVLPIRRC